MPSNVGVISTSSLVSNSTFRKSSAMVWTRRDAIFADFPRNALWEGRCLFSHFTRGGASKSGSQISCVSVSVCGQQCHSLCQWWFFTFCGSKIMAGTPQKDSGEKKWPGLIDETFPEVFTTIPKQLMSKKQKPGQLSDTQIKDYFEKVCCCCCCCCCILECSCNLEVVQPHFTHLVHSGTGRSTCCLNVNTYLLFRHECNGL